MAKKVKTKKPVKVKPVKKSTKPAKIAKKAAPAKKVSKKPVKAKTSVKKAVKPAAKKNVAKKVTVKKAIKTAVKKTVKAKPVKKATLVKANKPKTQTSKPTAKPVKVDYAKAITPLGDRLVIRLTQAERVTPGGLILPDSVSSTSGYLKGEVLAAGHGTYTKKGHHKLLDVKIGDVVLFNEYSSTKVKYNNEDLHIVHESEILGVAE